MVEIDNIRSPSEDLEDKLNAESLSKYLGGKLLRASELAEETGLSYRTIWKLLKEGKITSYRVGVDWFTTRKDVIEYLNSVRKDPIVKPGA